MLWIMVTGDSELKIQEDVTRRRYKKMLQEGFVSQVQRDLYAKFKKDCHHNPPSARFKSATLTRFLDEDGGVGVGKRVCSQDRM
jgi:hypothetical protein